MLIYFHWLAAEIGFQGNPWSPTRWQELTVLHQSCGLKESQGNESILPIACIWIISNLDQTSETQLALLNNLGKWIRFYPQEFSFKKKKKVQAFFPCQQKGPSFSLGAAYLLVTCIIAANGEWACSSKLAYEVHSLTNWQ